MRSNNALQTSSITTRTSHTRFAGSSPDARRTSWWSHGEQSPHTVSLQDNPEFKAMMDEVKADLATQLTRVREMDSRGELAAVTEQ